MKLVPGILPACLCLCERAGEGERESCIKTSIESI